MVGKGNAILKGCIGTLNNTYLSSRLVTASHAYRYETKSFINLWTLDDKSIMFCIYYSELNKTTLLVTMINKLFTNCPLVFISTQIRRNAVEFLNLNSTRLSRVSLNCFRDIFILAKLCLRDHLLTLVTD